MTAKANLLDIVQRIEGDHMQLKETYSNEAARVQTHLWRPENPVEVAIDLSKGLDDEAGIEERVTAALLADDGMWKIFGFHTSWLKGDEAPLKAFPITWSKRFSRRSNPSGSFTLEASRAEEALVLIYSTASALRPLQSGIEATARYVKRRDAPPLWDQDGSVYMRVVIALGIEGKTSRILSVALTCKGNFWQLKQGYLSFKMASWEASLDFAYATHLEWLSNISEKGLLSSVRISSKRDGSDTSSTSVLHFPNDADVRHYSVIDENNVLRSRPIVSFATPSGAYDNTVGKIRDANAAPGRGDGQTPQRPSTSDDRASSPPVGETSGVQPDAEDAESNAEPNADTTTLAIRRLSTLARERLPENAAKSPVAAPDRFRQNAKDGSCKELFRVTESVYGQIDRGVQTPLRRARAPVEYPLGEFPYFSNKFAIQCAHTHAKALFDALDEAGFDVDTYFKFARIPLLLQTRAEIMPGPGKDGRAVNAQALFVKSKVLGRRRGQDDRPLLEVRFGDGLDSARRKNVSRSPTRAEYVSTAVDSRWAWHEFGHVLLGATTNHLELAFCHGICDALSAIKHDPDCELTGPLRFLTFPWIEVPRRHDRTTKEGWSWIGGLHTCETYTESEPVFAPKGYVTEQIMSSSLFKLYMDIAGGENADASKRKDASDNVIGLTLHTIALAGDMYMVPVRTPQQFVALMLDADVLRNAGKYKKEIVDAFETQGLIFSH